MKRKRMDSRFNKYKAALFILKVFVVIFNSWLTDQSPITVSWNSTGERFGAPYSNKSIEGNSPSAEIKNLHLKSTILLQWMVKAIIIWFTLQSHFLQNEPTKLCIAKHLKSYLTKNSIIIEFSFSVAEN